MAVLDATLIESNSRPKNKILEEEMPEDERYLKCVWRWLIKLETMYNMIKDRYI